MEIERSKNYEKREPEMIIFREWKQLKKTIREQWYSVRTKVQMLEDYWAETERWGENLIHSSTWKCMAIR